MPEGALLRELVLLLELPVFELYLLKIGVLASVFGGDGGELTQEGLEALERRVIDDLGWIELGEFIHHFVFIG